jgi:hypothetical protein
MCLHNCIDICLVLFVDGISYLFIYITYIKGRMKLPLNPDGQSLRTVVKYSEDVVKLPLNPSIHPSHHPSMDGII